METKKTWRGKTQLDRFYSSFVMKSKEECWEWTRSIRNGYGRVYFDGRIQTAHRLSFEIFNKKKIKTGMHICHKCDNRRCVNPNHLFEGTVSDNMRDMNRKGRRVKVLGEDVNTAVLSREEVLKIRKLLKDGVTRYKIAKQFDVGWSTIDAIYKNKSWAWL